MKRLNLFWAVAAAVTGLLCAGACSDKKGLDLPQTPEALISYLQGDWYCDRITMSGETVIPGKDIYEEYIVRVEKYGYYTFRQYSGVDTVDPSGIFYSELVVVDGHLEDAEEQFQLYLDDQGNLIIAYEDIRIMHFIRRAFTPNVPAGGQELLDVIRGRWAATKRIEKNGAMRLYPELNGQMLYIEIDHYDFKIYKGQVDKPVRLSETERLTLHKNQVVSMKGSTVVYQLSLDKYGSELVQTFADGTQICYAVGDFRIDYSKPELPDLVTDPQEILKRIQGEWIATKRVDAHGIEKKYPVDGEQLYCKVNGDSSYHGWLRGAETTIDWGQPNKLQSHDGGLIYLDPYGDPFERYELKVGDVLLVKAFMMNGTQKTYYKRLSTNP